MPAGRGGARVGSAPDTSRPSHWSPCAAVSPRRQRSKSATPPMRPTAGTAAARGRSSLRCYWRRWPPAAAVRGRGRRATTSSGRPKCRLDALLDLKVIHRMLPRRDPEGRSVKANGAVVMAGDLARVTSKASMINGSKETRGSHTLWLLCLVDDGARRRTSRALHGVPPHSSTRAALNVAPGRTYSAH